MPRKKIIKKVSAVKKEKVPKFSLSLNLGELHYKAKGESVVEAMEKLNVDRFKIRGFGIFILKSGNKKAELKYTPFQIRRILVNKIAALIFEKRILMMLK